MSTNLKSWACLSFRPSLDGHLRDCKSPSASIGRPLSWDQHLPRKAAVTLRLNLESKVGAITLLGVSGEL